LDHDDATWDSSKGKSFRKQRKKGMRYGIQRRVKGATCTCNRKPQTLLEIAHSLNVSLDFFNKHGTML
jgi:hypothetical protein